MTATFFLDVQIFNELQNTTSNKSSSIEATENHNFLIFLSTVCHLPERYPLILLSRLLNFCRYFNLEG